MPFQFFKKYFDTCGVVYTPASETLEENDYEQYNKDHVSKISRKTISTKVDKLYRDIMPMIIENAEKGKTYITIDYEKLRISQDVMDMLVKKFRKKKFHIETVDKDFLSSDESSSESEDYSNYLKISWK